MSRCRSCDAEIDAAWAAGFLDADGSFCLYRKRDLRRQMSAGVPHHHVVCIRVSQTGSRGPVDKLQLIFGGNVTASKRSREFIWTVQGAKKAAQIIRRVLPHLCRKKAEAGLLLAYCEGPGMPLPRSHRVSATLFQERERLAEEMEALRERRRVAM